MQTRPPRGSDGRQNHVMLELKSLAEPMGIYPAAPSKNSSRNLAHKPGTGLA